MATNYFQSVDDGRCAKHGCELQRVCMACAVYEPRVALQVAIEAIQKRIEEGFGVGDHPQYIRGLRFALDALKGKK